MVVSMSSARPSPPALLFCCRGRGHWCGRPRPGLPCPVLADFAHVTVSAINRRNGRGLDRRHDLENDRRSDRGPGAAGAPVRPAPAPQSQLSARPDGRLAVSDLLRHDAVELAEETIGI